MIRKILTISTLYVVFALCAFSQSVLLDDFESIDGWEPFASDGVRLTVSQDEGISGNAIRLDYTFEAGAGYCGIRKSLNLPMPDNYRILFNIKGDGPRNNLELKLLDASGENVWWHNRRNFAFPRTWEQLVTRKRHIEFAWGPEPGDPDTIHALEFVIAAGEGGSGTVFIDMLYFEPLEDVQFESLEPSVAASSSAGIGFEPDNIFDHANNTRWQSASGLEDEWLQIDMGRITEVGGFIIEWFGNHHAVDYDINISTDGVEWKTAYSMRDGSGKRDYIYMPETDTRFIQLDLIRAHGDDGFGITYLEVQPVTFSQTSNDFFRRIAKDTNRGFYPRYLYNEQSYWTVVGVDSDSKEGLLNEDGMLEVEKEMFSIEPFVYVNRELVTWADVEINQSLLYDYLPVPSVHWSHESFEFSVEAVAAGKRGISSLFAAYTVSNSSEKKLEGTLYLTIRPFQVNPPWQFLNITGGFAPIYSIDYNEESSITVNSAKEIILLTGPDNFGATRFDKADVISYISQGTVPEEKNIEDTNGFGTGVMGFNFSLLPGEEKKVIIEVPFYQESQQLFYQSDDNSVTEYYETIVHEVVTYWRERLNPVGFIVPESAKKYIDVLRSNLAYILINRDGPAIQPGSRSYERSWIRDGSLTSGALLRFGFNDPVREFIEWYAPYQYENGKIPCVVDRRGPDPVDEHDSPGQFIYAIMEYYRFTNDTTFLEGKWKRVRKTLEYIEYLINQRKTDEYRTGDIYKRAFYGLVPESISHEGYADKPMHSYWDNFFILKGLKGAAEMAAVLGDTDYADKYSFLMNEFRENLYNSILLAMDINTIDYIPGCVELGDFDATSTTIGIFPCGELDYIPEVELQRTFEKYIEHFNRRLDPEFEWNDYTPYEIRAAGTFVFLDRKERTHKLLDFFFDDLRPYNWNHWAEVVWRDYRKPRFIGDMPHTWVGSDYINVIRNIFLYDIPDGNAVVIAAGIPEEWIDTETGIGITNMPTYYGKLNYHMRAEGKNIAVSISGDFDVDRGIIIIKSPREIPVKNAQVNGSPAYIKDGNEIMVTGLPAEVIIKYQ